MDLSALSSLREVEPGFWTVADAPSAVSYPESGHTFSHDVAEDSFWFRHRTACILAAMRRLPPGGPVFDVGGGTGHLTAAIRAAGYEAALVEPGGTGARLARERGVEPVVHAAFHDAGFRPGSLGAVGLFDVVEHVEDDHGLLGRVRTAVVPGGRVYLTVPAEPWLWSDEDVRAGHHRRYRSGGFLRLLEAADLEVEYLTAFFRPLLLPILLLRALPSRIGLGERDREAAARQHAPGGGVLARTITGLLAPEIKNVAAGHVMRLGASLLAVARVR